MNQELQKQLADMLAKLTGVVEHGASWTAAQIPPLVQEKIAYGRVVETTELAVAIVATCLGVVAFRWCVIKLKEASYNEDAPFIAGVIISGIGGTIAFVAACFQFELTAMVWFAPRLYIVEWLRTLIGK